MRRNRLPALTLCAACLLTPVSARAATRRLSLADAVELGLRVDPTFAEARIAKDRSKLGVLRAQLDRVSLKIDGSLQELFNKSNIGGPTVYNCTLGPASFQTDPQTCMSMGGTSTLAGPDVQSPQSGFGTFNVSANLTVPIFSGFRVSSNVKRAQRLDDAAQVNIRQSRKDLALSVARAYWAVRRLGLLLDVQKGSLDRLKDAETVADGRVKAGLAPPIDYNRAKLLRLQTAASIADLDGQLKEATVQLAVALGVSDDLVLTDNPNVPAAAPPSVDDLLASARSDRPELASARLQIEVQKQVVKMAMSNYYPQLAGFGLFQFTNNAFNPLSGSRSVTDVANPFTGIAGNLTVGATLSMNFFDTLNTYTSTRDARYELARLLEEQRRAERLVEADVRSARAKVEHLYERRAPLLEALAVARDNLSILEARYKNGDALVIEYLNGQNDLLNAEQAVVDITAQLQLAWIELQAAVGRVVGVNG